MKHSIHSFIASGLVSCALAIGVAATPSNAFAQASSEVRANIPFAFQVGSKVLPAGTYTFRKESENILLLSGTDAHDRALAMVLPATNWKAPHVGTITFAKYGERYFLHNISAAESSTSYDCPLGKQEKAIIREMKYRQPTEVAVNVMPTLR
jgi:hypothetical protein